jgi:glycosyltransferase involved in cell wall biosynthesis
LRALFLTWDGPQQSYLESLFFPIFAGLAGRGVAVHTLQLTWANADQLQPVRRAASRLGLRYESIRIPEPVRRVGLPLAVGLGAASVLRYMRRERMDVLFPRSLIPMAMALVARVTLPTVDLVFEADGLMADERADFGGWSRGGPSYRLLRWVEAEGVRRARSVVCRTQAAREVLTQRAGPEATGVREKIFVAPNAKDALEFAPGTPSERSATRARYGIPQAAPWVIYVGSVGPQYLPSQMVAAMAGIRRKLPEARFSWFTRQAAAVRAFLVAEPGLAAVTQIQESSPSEIPSLLAAADLGFGLRLDAPSQHAICPIKVAEYLLCGLPVVTSCVGDLPQQLADQPAAFLVSETSPATADAIADWFATRVLPSRNELRESARKVGMKWFALPASVDSYERVLRYRAASGLSQ